MKKLNFLYNAKLKVMSLVLAILSWGVVKQITNNDKTIADVPVQILLPEGWAIRDRELADVEITFRGTREDLLMLDERNVTVELELDETGFEPEKRLRITPREVTYTGSNARVIAIQPDSFLLRLDKEGQKQVPVIINRIGEPPEGLKVEAIEVSPKLVTLYGAEELLQEINSLQSAPLTLSDKIQSFEQRLDVLPPHDQWVGRISPPRIRVKVTVAGLSVEQRFQNVPLLVYAPVGETVPEGIQANPATVEVFIKGSPQLLDNLTADEIKAFVSATRDATPGNTADITVLVPVGLEVLGVQPPVVQLTVPNPTPAPEAP